MVWGCVLTDFARFLPPKNQECKWDFEMGTTRKVGFFFDPSESLHFRPYGQVYVFENLDGIDG